MGERLWIGGAFDLGGAFLRVERQDTTYNGLELFPRFEIDFLILGRGRFKMAGFFGLGPQICPYLGGTYGSGYYSVDVTAWMVQITALLGLTLGG